MIYGKNGLRTPEQLPFYQEQVRATAAMVANYRLQNSDYMDEYRLLSKRVNFCAGEPLNHQRRIAKCSGFLISDDLLVTAAHCIRDQYDCEGNSWLFDFDRQVAERGVIAKNKVYHCKEVVYATKDRVTGVDFAIVRLARRVEDRMPMHLAQNPVDAQEYLMAIGYPLGTSVKLSINGHIRNNSNPYYFRATLDTFHGNSGAPVLGQNSGSVIGLLVRGESDLERDEVQNCLRVKRCADSGCRGEDVVRIKMVVDKLDELGLNYN